MPERTRLVHRAVWSVVIGTGLSIALALTGPLVLPTPHSTMCADESSKRRTSWLATAYVMDSTIGGKDTEAMLQVTRATTFDLTEKQQLNHWLMGWPNTWAGFFKLIESGFPARSFRAMEMDRGFEITSSDSPSMIPIAPLRVGVLEIRTPNRQTPLWQSWVPLLPIWQGLLINATTWSAGVWLLLFATAYSRRARRRRRNLCAHCAYDLRATPPTSPCPECGRGTMVST